MRKLRAVALVVGIVMLSVVPSHAEDRSVTYVAAPGLRVSSSEVPAGIGGYAFTLPRQLTHVKVDDLNGAGVRATVCQENSVPDPPDPSDLGNICGDGGDDVTTGGYCTASGFRNVTSLNFRPGNPITVFVRTDGPAFGCAQPGTAGTITMRF